MAEFPTIANLLTTCSSLPDWLQVKYEDLVADPTSESKRVLEFLDIKWDDSVLNFAEHVRSKTVRSPTYHAVAKPIYQSARGRWRNYDSKFGEATRMLQPFVEEFGYD